MTVASLSEKRRLLREQLLRKEGFAAEKPRRISRRTRPGPAPLSFGQQRLWFLHQLDPAGAAYNISEAVGLDGRLDPLALGGALAEVARRHEVLRTVYPQGTDEEPVPTVAPAAPAILLLDLAGLPADLRAAPAAQAAARFAAAPFNLERGPVVRAALLRLGEDHAPSHVLTLALHHIASDGWSMGLLLRELVTLYEAFAAGETSPLPDLPLQYADFAAWQREHLSGAALERHLAYWRERLAGAPTLLQLPTDRPWPAVPSFRGGKARFGLKAAAATALRGLARREGATPFMVVLSALGILLQRYCRQSEALIGTPMANRGRPELEGLIGFFVNTLALRVDLEGDPRFAELVGRVRETVLGAEAHQDLPFEQLVDALDLPRDLSRTPLFQAFLVYQNLPPVTERPRSLALSRFGFESPTAQFELSFFLSEDDLGLGGTLTYRSQLFDAPTTARLVRHFEILLEGAALTPGTPLSQLPLLGLAERHQLLTEWNDTATSRPERHLLYGLFADQAVRTPDAPAATFQGEALSYAQLADRADRVAHRLRRLGCGPESRIAVALERNLDLLTAILGVLQTGAAYVPLDPEYPRERLAYLLDDSRPAALLTEESLRERLPVSHVPQVLVSDLLAETVAEVGGEDEDDPEAWEGLGGDLLAYVIYTSGSTGRPKGAMVAHAGMINHLSIKIADLGLDRHSRVAQTASQCFDISVWQLLAPLLVGGSVHLVGEATAHEPERLLRFVAQERITVLEVVPSLLGGVLESLATPGASFDRSSLEWLLVTGEACAPDLAERWLALSPHTRLLNAYGPTECSDDVTHYELAGPGGRPSLALPIGRPLTNTLIYVLDSGGRPTALGVVGELCVAGRGVGRGYLGRPERTAQVFVPDPLSGTPGSRLYRTGDLARWLASGALEFLGRLDHQVKVRGFRIELGEIEALLLTQDGVREAVVLARDDSSLGQQLVAYVAGEAATETLRQCLRERLPDYMVPAAFVHLDALPLTPNGKVDRKALPSPTWQSAAESYLAPRTTVEQVLAGIWAELLGRERVGADDHFFDLGGHSLLATRVMARLRAAFGVEMPLRDLFEAPRLADLAARVEGALRTGAERPTPPLVPAPREGPLPLSFAQQRLWIIDQIEPGTPIYNIPVALGVEGPLDLRVLALCLGEIVRRHEALRTSFATSADAPVQVIQPAVPFPLPVVDLSRLPESRRGELALHLVDEEARRPFDLARGRLLRGALLRLAAEDHFVALTMHHIASDGWSIGILVREVTTLFAAFAEDRPSPLPELPVQYADFALWQHSWLHGAALEGEISYWRSQLAGLPPRLELPTDRPRPAVQSFRGASRPVRLSAELTRRAEALSRREGATPFMVLMAGFQALLARYSGQSDLAVGTPVAGRDRIEIEGLIGFFVNTLVLRGDLSGEPSFRELLGRTREAALAAHTHQDVPFERLVQELSPERSLAQTPLFQVMFVLQNVPTENLEVKDLRLRPVGGGGAMEKFDLTLSLGERDGGFGGSIGYATNLFDGPTIDRLIRHFERLLAAAVAAPEISVSVLPLLSGAERHQLVAEWNATAMAAVPADLCIHHLVETQAARTPQALAVVRGDLRLTYRELNEQANRLAHLLIRLGVGPERKVGIFVERSPSLVVSLLAVLKAGGAYVPLDPSYPGDRLGFMIEDAEVAALVIGAGVEDLLPAEARAPGVHPIRLGADRQRLERESAADPKSGVLPGNLSYLIYTSGSTGRPKGVAIEHRNAVSMLLWALDALDPVEGAVGLWSTSISFDVSVFELFFTLARGGKLVVAENILELPNLPEAGEITMIHAVPSALAELLRTERLPASVETAHVGGEAVPRGLVDEIYRHPNVRRVRNLYGPSENTTFTTLFPLAREGERVPIGRPIGNGRMVLLDSHLAPLPVGVPGELYVGGQGVARGYLGRPGLTAERFLPDPFAEPPGARMYRVGDIARLLPDGSFEYLGRIDHQVKVRGFRIELGEIEAALGAHPRVLQAVARVWVERGHPRLAAYVVPDGEAPSPEELRAFLAAKLPPFMLPSAFIALPVLPLSPNGKVDRRSLPEPRLAENRETPRESTVPRTPVESVLARIWADVLGVEAVGTHQNFFTLGGDSILSIQVVTRALREGVRITPRQLFQHQTVAELAAVANTVGGVAAEQGLVTGPVPLTPIQRWFFENDPVEPHHFNQTVLFETARPLDRGPLKAALGRIERHHDALRLRFSHSPTGWQQAGGLPAVRVPLTGIDLTALPGPDRPRAVAAAAARAQASLDLRHGPLHRALVFDLGPREPGRFFWAIHHLVVDGVSWRFLLEDLAALYDGFAQGRSPELPAKTTSFRRWAEELAGHADAPETEAELPYWLSQPWTAAPRLPVDRAFAPADNTVASTRSASLLLDADETRALLQEVPEAYGTRINDALLAALARGFQDWTGSPLLQVDLEGHGREEIFADVDLSRTLGWFTSLHPLLLDLRGAPDPGASLKAVKEALRRVPRGGLGHGLLRAGRHGESLGALPPSQIVFNYLGQFDQTLAESSPFRPAREPVGPSVSPRATRRHLLELNGGVFGGRLRFTCTFSAGVHRQESIQRLVDAVAARLREIVAHCRAPGVWGYTPSDFPLAALGQEQIDALVHTQAAQAAPAASEPPGLRRPIEDVYPLSPMQQGMLFHTLFAPAGGVYLSQTSFRVSGGFDPPSFKRALARVIERHAVLRTSFVWRDLEQPLQVVHRQAPLPVREEDWRGLSEAEQRQRLEDYLVRDAVRGFDLGRPPLLRFLLARETEGAFRIVWSLHLLLADGWSTARIVGELFAHHGAFEQGLDPQVEPPPHYRSYIAWLARQDHRLAESFWRRELAGLREPTPLPGDRGPGREPVVSQSHASLGEEATGALQAFARAHQLTVNTLAQGAWALLLARLGGRPEAVFGITIAGRPPELPGAETMIGPFINTLPLRAEVAPEAPLHAWLRQLQDRHSEARQFGHVPLVTIQGWSELPRGVPLFENLLVFENYPVDTALREESKGLVIDDLRAREVTNYALTLVGLPGRRLGFSLSWDRMRFDAASIARLLSHLVRLLDDMVQRPEANLESLSHLADGERHQLLVEWNDTDRARGDVPCLHHLIADRAARSPDAVAVVCADRSLTFGQLGRRAGGLALRLAELGVGPEVPVVLFLDRSVETLIALVGVLAAGGVYVPVDPATPAERIAWVLEDSRAAVVVTTAGLAGRLPADAPTPLLLDGTESTAAFAAEAGLDSAAYVIYTSGSTGRPKGVVVGHRSVVAFAGALRETAYGGEPGPLRVGVNASFSFDASVQQIVQLAWGHCLHILPQEVRLDPEALVEMVRRQRLDVLDCTPSLLRLLLQAGLGEGDAAPALVLVGGEAVDAELRDTALARPRTRFWNVYGPTECTVNATVTPFAAEGPASRIGLPLPEVRIYLAAVTGSPAAVGIAGELQIGGAGLARGYFGRPDLTAERFVPDPFGGASGGRLYRTGDLAHRLADGSLDFLGRVDRQVKLRGFRIEPAEIETVLAAIDGVRQAAVILREDAPGDRRLVAYVVGDVLTGALRQALRERLPDYLVPAAFVALPALPLTPSGKVDRQALPAPERQSAEGSLRAPQTPVEEVLAGIWAELLGLERVGVADHFFESGGHSLLATRMMSRLRSAFDVEMPIRDLFEAPRLSDLAIRIETALRAGLGRFMPPLAAVPRQDPLPLSFAQQRLWFIDQLEPGTALYNIPAALRVEGPLDPQVLALCLGEIVRRHETLRSVFDAVEGSPVQVIRPAAPFRFPAVDLSGLPERVREASALALSGALTRLPFDLARGPLLRGALLRLAEGDHVVALSMHHIVSDGWSMGILVREVTALYAAFAGGLPSPLPELPLQYADFAAWQHSWLHGDVLEDEISFWRMQLADLPPRLELPTDRPQPTVQSFRGAGRPVRLSPRLGRQAQALSRREGASLFMVLLAGFQALLGRHSGQRDLAVGTPVAGRNRVEIEGLIGFFVNTLVLRGDLSGEPSFRDLLGRTREAALAAHLHQDVPFERLVQELSPERSLAQTPLFQVLFVLQNVPTESLEIQDLRLRPVGGTGTMEKFDLTLSLDEHDGGGLSGSVGYAVDLFDAATVERLVRHFERLLAAAVASPELRLSELPLLAEAERHQALYEWAGRPAPRAFEAPIHELFAAQAVRSPHAVALVCGGAEMTYADLDARADLLASILRARGVGPEVLTGICAERSVELIVGLLAILKAGGAYLPLDPDFPEERLRLLIEDADATLVLAGRGTAGRLPRHAVRVVELDGEPPPLGVPVAAGGANADSLAYVMYTSGSTGRPKGVSVPHRGVARLCRDGGFARFDAGEVFLQAAPVSFDASTLEIWACLLNGGRLVLPPPGALSLEQLGRAVREHQVTTLWLTAGLFHLMVDERLQDLAGVRQLLAGGDVLSVPHVERVLAELPQCRVINGYGPTENTTFTCCHCMERTFGGSDSVPIGRPIQATRIYVVDRELAPVPAGVAGELLTGGAGLARGYLKRPDLTAERFVPDSQSGEPGERLYRTGDLCRHLGDGTIEFLGRIDQQVKIRGFRVEPGEIEAVLRQHPDVREAAVVVHEERSATASGDRRLVAYVVGDVAADELRRSLREQLPDYMVPATFVTLGALPFSANGKLDRRALAQREVAHDRSPGAAFAAPATTLELRLVQIWEDLLGVRPLSVLDNFFKLGGHSLLAVRLVAQIKRRLGHDLPLAALFEGPTVRQLARHLETESFESSGSPLVALQPTGTKPPFFCVHPIGGEVLAYYHLAQRLGPDQPFYGLQSPPLHEDAGTVYDSIESMASVYLAEVLRVSPEGPYLLGGWSFGGVIAFEMAQQLRRRGAEVALLALFDTARPSSDGDQELDEASLIVGPLAALARNRGKDLELTAEELRGLSKEAQVERALERLRRSEVVGPEIEAPLLRSYLAGYLSRMRAMQAYSPRPYAGRITFFRPLEQAIPTPERLAEWLRDEPTAAWGEIASEGVEVYDTPGRHESMLDEGHVGELAKILATCITIAGPPAVAAEP